MTTDELLVEGMTVAFAFFAVGVVVSFAALVLARVVGFLRNLLG